MSRNAAGVLVPLLIALFSSAAVLLWAPKPPVKHGILAGIAVALAQTYLSVGALKWAWNKRFFYWVWGGGMLFRMMVFAAMAFVVYRYTTLNFVATMLALVTATTFFLVWESATILNPKKHRNK